MSKMADKPKCERPREKLITKGVKSLTNNELAQIIIGSGNKNNDVTKISRKLVQVLREKETKITLDDLYKIPGISHANATKILAAFELVNRYGDNKHTQVIDSPDKVLPLLEDIRDKQQEYFVCITLDGANRLIKKRIITIGTLNASLVHPREVFAPAIEDRAASIIVAHNHPSGSLRPSKEDEEATDRLVEAGKLLGIRLINHIIVTKSGYISLI